MKSPGIKTVSYKSSKAFTLVELLVVISIIALLVSILMPSLGRARGMAKQTVCLAHMRQLGLALEMFAQENDDRVVGGRFHNKGDWLSVNSFYSNLTPYLDPGKNANDTVWAMTNVEAKEYNAVWEKLICPGEKDSSVSSGTFFQGISIRTVGLNIGVGVVPKTSYSDGYGLQDWGSGTTRKLSSIGHASGVMAFCDTRNQEYIYAGVTEHYSGLGRDIEVNYPERHPGGYGVTFVDGHGEMLVQSVIFGNPHSPLWRVK